MDCRSSWDWVRLVGGSSRRPRRRGDRPGVLRRAARGLRTGVRAESGPAWWTARRGGRADSAAAPRLIIFEQTRSVSAVNQGLLPIGLFSRASQLSIKTLRAYHEAGILVPAE